MGAIMGGQASQPVESSFPEDLRDELLETGRFDMNRRMKTFGYSSCPTIQRQLEQMSTSEVTIRATILPGHSFHGDTHGVWVDNDHDFLKDCALLHIFGFNDYNWYDRNKAHVARDNPTIRLVDSHVDWYKKKGCKLVFTELNDYHPAPQDNRVRWLSNRFQELHHEDPKNVIYVPSKREDQEKSLTLCWPPREDHLWADKYHLNKDGMKWWLPRLRDLSYDVAKAVGVRKIMWLTDSSFTIHNGVYHGQYQANDGGKRRRLNRS